ncbi:MAG: cupin domain-containing protein [Spirochaetes bacterium]|nr:cupin domain-containing protein [Spirochaetota bacterium]
MEQNEKYSIHMDERYGFLKLIDVPALAAACKEKWYNQTLCRVNGNVVRLGVFNEGEFHWHKHDKEDEFFFVLQGSFHIELENEAFKLGLHQGLTVPAGVLHRTFVKEPAVVLMVEGDTVTPTGDK